MQLFIDHPLRIMDKQNFAHDGLPGFAKLKRDVLTSRTHKLQCNLQICMAWRLSILENEIMADVLARAGHPTTSMSEIKRLQNVISIAIV
ncbi:hypothetical protein [Rhizobium sp. RU36D]|uniref:hypothetical protein n=1 Tax=Rhizobium sp. RU36D TaxID=1907415 RepID=UPI0015C49154|nr:hypothetical protein [Rhizobium sp. RU36D]